jgi:hypothetical protein
MRCDKLEKKHDKHNNNVQLLTDLVARLIIPPHNTNDNQNQNNYDNRNWDSGLRVEIPDFSRNLKLREFLDWTYIVDEVFELKEIPPGMIHFQERASA